jgi:hypothetical protein
VSEPVSEATPGECWKRMDIYFGTDRCVTGIDCEGDHPAVDGKPVSEASEERGAW